MNIEEAKQRLTIPMIWERLQLPGIPLTSCRSPFREDKHGSFSVSKDGRLFNDFSTGEAGDAVTFLAIATGLSPEGAGKRFIELAGGSAAIVAPAPRRAAADPQPRQKPIFPDFERGTDADLHTLANLRKISFDSCWLARAVGLLRFTTWHGRPAWIITDKDRLNAQARRMDGQPWDSIKAKAQTLPGSWASWPLGIRTGSSHETLLLVEGGADLLAAVHFIQRASAETLYWPVAMLGASQRIHPDALNIFAGKRVRIYPHTDQPGLDAAERWTAQLERVGATVDAFSFTGLRKLDGSLVGDLNDVTQIHPDDELELEGILP
jgi:hypothetical protein